MNAGNRPLPGERTGDVVLFSTESSVVAIDSPIKGMILSLIAKGEISFDEIVKRTKKAKSTVSVHIRDLEDSGLITSRPDPHDHRKRILSLASTPIGRLTNKDRDAPQARGFSNEPLPFTQGDIASFFRFTLRVLRTEAMKLGINTDPVLERAGYHIGCVLAPMVRDRDLEEKIQMMDQFWQQYGLGSMTLVAQDPITLQVTGCFECMDLPVTGHGACAFDTGVLSALFAEEMQGLALVTEVECYSSGFDHCLFIITKKSSD